MVRWGTFADWLQGSTIARIEMRFSSNGSEECGAPWLFIPHQPKEKVPSKTGQPGAAKSRLLLGSFGQHTWLSGLTSSQCDRRASFCASQTAFMKWLFLTFKRFLKRCFNKPVYYIYIYICIGVVSNQLRTDCFGGLNAHIEKIMLINWDDHPIFRA